MSMNWIDLSRYGIHVGLADIDGGCKPTIAIGEETAFTSCRSALEEMGFTKRTNGHWQLEWTQWPSSEQWDTYFPMHKKRPLADIVEHVVLDESSAIGLIGRNAITQTEYEAGVARKMIAAQSAAQNQDQPEQATTDAGDASSTEKPDASRNTNERIVKWPDFSAYGLDSAFVKVSREEKAFVHIQGAEPVKRLYRDAMERIGIEVTELNGKLDFRIPPGKSLSVDQIKEVLPRVEAVQLPLSSLYRNQVPEAPAEFDATDYFTGKDFRSRLLDRLQNGGEDRFTVDELKSVAVGVTGLDERLIRHEFGLGDRFLIEHAETTLTNYFKANLVAEMTPDERIDLGRKLDNLMPRSGAKTAQSVSLQQFSTPLAISAALQTALHLDKADSIWEPTIGNGSLVSLASDPANVYGIELDGERLKRVHEEGYTNVTQGDAIHASVGSATMERVITNPPFGSFPDKMGRREFQTDVPVAGQAALPSISLLAQDKYIALRHLEQLDKHGFGGLILGADNPARFKAGEYSEETENFLNFVGDNYNIIDVRYVEGKLYGSHGAGWPLLMVVTGGKRDMVHEYDLPEKLEVISDIADLKRYTHEVSSLVQERLDELAATQEQPEKQRESSERNAEGESLEPTAHNPAPAEEAQEQEQENSQNPDNSDVEEAQALEENDNEETFKELEAKQEEKGEWPELEEAENDSHQKHAISAEEKVVVYKPRSRMPSLNKRVPSNLASPINDALDRVETTHGDIDAWVADEMGWTLGELEERLAAEQIDAVALSMFQAENGKGFILGDNTGVGKGRVVAALYAWGIKQGKKPIFCTSKEGLFYDILRDFHDIGEGDTIKPMILNNTKDIKDPETGEVLLKKTPRNVVKEAIDKNTIPAGYNGVFMTYSQVNRDLHRSPKASWLINVADDNVMLFDEVHNASGSDSNTGANIGAAVRKASFTLGASATYAKRPDNLGLYHFTSMFAGGDPETVIGAVSQGGPEYQEVLSTMLAASGQLIVRSHRPAPAPEAKIVNPQYEEGYSAREFSDRLARVLDAMTAVADAGEEIVNEENREIKEFIDGLPESAKGNYDGWKAQSLNFGSQAYNIVKVAMYAAKADAIVDEVEAEIKAGRRPAIALEGTMETFLREAHLKEFNTRMAKLMETHQEGEPMPPVGTIKLNLTYRDTLMKFLDRMVTIKRTDRYGNESEEPMVGNLAHFKEAYEKDKLNEAISEALSKKTITSDDAAMLGYYFAVAEAIDELPESLPASPLDYVHSKLKARGIQCVEMTGRNLALDYDTEDGVPEFRYRSEKEKDRKAAAREFNNGGAQAILFNSAAAEGVSLHPSLKFKNKEPRTMLFWQVIGDVAAFSQQAGRIDRSGQDENIMPKYKIIALDTPSEKRVLMNLINKTASLNANKSADRDTGIGMRGVPMMNRVGDLVTFEVLNKHPNRDAICGKLRINLEKELDEFSESGMKTGTGTDTGLHSRLTGRLSRMQLVQSEPLMEELEEAYKDRIAWLDQQGTNPLRTQIHDFKGTVVNEHEIFPRSGPSEFEGDVRALEMDYIDYINPIPFAKVEQQVNRSRELLDSREMGAYPLKDMWGKIDTGMKQRIWENGVHHAKAFMETLPSTGKTDALIEAIRTRPASISRDEDVIERLEKLVRRFDTFKKLRDQLAVGAEIKSFPAKNAVFDCEVEAADMVVTRILPPGSNADPCLGGKWSIRLTSPDPDVGQFDLSMNQLMEHLNNTPTMRIGNEPLTLEEIHDRFTDDREPRSVNCKRFALVGQLFTAYDITNNADKGLGRGKPGIFTTADGKKLRGIIMPRAFDVGSVGHLLNSDFNIAHKDVVLAYINHLTESSRHPVIYTIASYQNKQWSDIQRKQFTAGTGAVVFKDPETGSWKLQVSGVKRTGGNYHQDAALQDLLSTDFATCGNMSKLMEATFEEDQLEAVVDRLISAHGQVIHGFRENADWFRDHMRERGQRLIQEQNNYEDALRQQHDQRQEDKVVAVPGDSFESNSGEPLEIDF